MDEAPDQIRSEIDQARSRLGQDLNTLEYRIKQEADWRVQFARRPWPFLGAVFAFALLAGAATGRD